MVGTGETFVKAQAFLAGMFFMWKLDGFMVSIQRLLSLTAEK